MSGESKAVFLSYASEDSEAAQRIADALRAAGIEIWFDRSELRGGDAWDRRIRQQIQDCRLFIAVVSAHTEARDEGYFRREWRLAVARAGDMDEKRAFLVPVVIDDTSERRAAVPEKLLEVQWTRLPAGEVPPTFVDRIAGLLRAEPRSASIAQPTALPSAAPSLPRLTRGARRAVLAVAALAVLIPGAMLIWRNVGMWPAPTPAPGSGNSIAVLPFLDMSEAHDQEYFSDGLTEELIDKLSRAQDLKVIARTSSFAFKNKAADVRSIASALGVAHLLEGSVRKAGKELRITVQLIRASDGTHLWSDTYERTDTDIFRVQDEIATTVAQMLHTKMIASSAAAPLSELESAAHDLTLKGEYFRLRGHAGDVKISIQYFEQAVALAPDSASAWAHLAAGYSQLVEDDAQNAQDARLRALEAIRRAQIADPAQGYVHRVRGSMHVILDQDVHAALQEFLVAQRAGLDPARERRNRIDIELMKYLISGKSDGILAVERAAITSDPLNVDERLRLGQILEQCSLLSQAEDVLRRGIAIDSMYGQLHATLSWVLHRRGRDAEAFSELAKESNPDAKELATIHLKAATGQGADALQMLAAYIPENQHTDAYEIAVSYVLLGDRNAALSWLERARSERQFGLHDLNTDNYWLPIRNEPRFRALLHELGFDRPVST